jgi:hypothetical protein
MEQNKIEKLIKTQVRFKRYDKVEDVYINKWTISNHGSFGFYPQGSYKPFYDTKKKQKKHLENT